MFICTCSKCQIKFETSERVGFLCPECYEKSLVDSVCHDCGKIFKSLSVNTYKCKSCYEDTLERQRLNKLEWIFQNKISSKFLIFCRDGFRCIYCGKSTLEDDCLVLNADHIVPKDIGGKSEAHNMITACEECNKAKSRIPLPEETTKMLLEVAKKRNEKYNIPQQRRISANKSVSAKKEILEQIR